MTTLLSLFVALTSSYVTCTSSRIDYVTISYSIMCVTMDCLLLIREDFPCCSFCLKKSRSGFSRCLKSCAISPVSRNRREKKIGFEKVKLERNADNSGREFYGGKWGLKSWKKNKAENFADKIRHQSSQRTLPAMFLQIRRTKI